jgi:hypothetical protein
LYDEILAGIRKNYRGAYDSYFLLKIGETLKVKNEKKFFLLKYFFQAGLGSKHRHTKNSAIEFWNCTFGKYGNFKENFFLFLSRFGGNLEYPEFLIQTLRQIKEKVKKKIQ